MCRVGQQADLTGRRLQGLPPSLSDGQTDGPRPPPRREAAINPSNLYGRFQAHRGSTTSRTRASSTPPSTVFNTKRKVRSSVDRCFLPYLGGKKVGGRSSDPNAQWTDRQRPATYYVELAAGKKKSTASSRRLNALVRIRH